MITHVSVHYVKYDYEHDYIRFASEDSVIVFGYKVPAPDVLYSGGYSGLNVLNIAKYVNDKEIEKDVVSKLEEFLAELSEEYEDIKELSHWTNGGFSYYITATSQLN